jgi:hypothetical protein
MNTNDTPDPLDRLFAEARRHAPFGEPSGFGFETRLRAVLAAPAAGFAETLASLSWRFAAACLPVALAAFVFLAVSHRHSLPDGVGGLVTQWAGLLPLGI